MKRSATLWRNLMPLSSRLSTPHIGKTPRRMTADEAVSAIGSNSDIFVHSQAATPTELLNALCKRVDSEGLKDLRPIHILLSGKVPWADKKYVDKLGYCSLGVNVDTSLAAIESAKKVIAIINPKVPRTCGNTIIHESRIDSFVEVDREIYGNPEEQQISE
ncbi:hypothetical protein NECAME_17960, partial [Necator americanus]